MGSKESSNLLKYKSKNPIKRFFLNRFLDKLKDLSFYVSPKTILDAGCGEGFTIEFLNKSPKLLKKLKFYGIDSSERTISRAKEIVPFADLKVGNVYNLPYPDSFFDLVICSEVLEHLKDPEKALLEVGRVSKKYLLLSVPNEPWFMISSLFSGQNILRLGKHPEHINFWNVNDFIELVKKYFTILKVITSFPWVLVLCRK